MIAKYIRCEVPEASRTDFSKGQSLWQEAAYSKGFIFQLGGWELATGQAVILARWTDMESVKAFMRLAHDAIADKANQAGCYSAISVSYLFSVMSIPSSNHYHKDRVDSGFIRIADCYIAPEKVDKFLLEQETLWNPGMQQVEGMLGGQIWQFNGEANHYLVTSYWQSESHHNHYATHHFPVLKLQAATNIIQTISVHKVQTEQSWQIAP